MVTIAFDMRVAAVLTGTSPSQLHRWRREGILLPEVQDAEGGFILYSYRDLVALRTIAFLRSRISLQRIRTAFEVLRNLEYIDHLSSYQFGAEGKNVVLKDPEGVIMELVGQPGQLQLFTFAEIFKPFRNLQGQEVVSFDRPRPHLAVNPLRLGGWPTIGDTRIRFDTVADLIDGISITPENVSHYYPNVTPEAARDAVDFDDQVRKVPA